MTRIAFMSALALTVMLSFNSCKKITQDQLINGLWQVNKVTIDTIDNYLTRLPSYNNGNDCCAYKLDFEKDNTVIAYYIANGNFNRIVAGNWEVTDYNEIYLQVDTFMDGIFKVSQPSIKSRKLTGAENHVWAFDGTALDTAYTVIEMKKI